MPDQKQSQKKTQKQLGKANVLESLKNIGSGTANTLGGEANQISKDFLAQLLGRARAQSKNYSGEIGSGESVAVDDIYSGRRENEEKLQKQISFERRLFAEEQELVSRKSQELKMQLNALMQEVKNLAAATPKFVEEVEIATFQAPINPGVYHVIFFEKLIEYIKDFKKNIESASTWLHSTNTRAQKKSFWGQYKSKHGGASRLLSSEDYAQRSAG
ncbi:MAG: DUF5660 family protein [Patescibacteria group bacterium]